MVKKIKTPAASADLSVTLVAWPKGTPIERVHSNHYGAAEFNPGKGQGRFSPINDRDGNPIPTLYGGESLSVALMETVLHDLPTPCEDASVDLSVLDKLAHSRLSPASDIQLIELNPRFMKKHGITQGELLGSTADCYPQTRKWAEKAHDDNPEAQGILWSSRQHGNKAIMLFGDRIDALDLEVTLDASMAATSATVSKELLTLADEMALVLIDRL